jgi:hypothetical protein
VRHSPGYVSEFRFLSSQSEELEDRIHQTHAKLAGIQPSQAENRLKSYSHEIQRVLEEQLNRGGETAAPIVRIFVVAKSLCFKALYRQIKNGLILVHPYRS